MKVRNYEKQELVIFTLLVLIIIEIFSFIFLFSYKVFEYKKINGIITNNNIVSLVVDKADKKILNKNNKIYFNNKELKYKVIEDKGVITKKNNKNYYEILIKIKTPKNKINEIINLSIRDKKTSVIKLFKKIGEGD